MPLQRRAPNPSIPSFFPSFPLRRGILSRSAPRPPLAKFFVPIILFQGTLFPAGIPPVEPTAQPTAEGRFCSTNRGAVRGPLRPLVAR